MSSNEVCQTFNELIATLESEEHKSRKSVQDVVAKLHTQLDGPEHALERLYLAYLLVKRFKSSTSNTSMQTALVRAIFPPTLNKRQAHLVSQLIPLALMLPEVGQLLDCLEYYVRHCDVINFPTMPLPVTLANDSYMFCAAVISRGYFLHHPDSKENLTRWLSVLVKLVPECSINLNKAIRYSLLEQPNDYKLHDVILDLIKERKSEQLSNQFIIDLSTSVANQPNNEILVDRLGQLLLIAYRKEMCSQSNQLKSILLNKFPNNTLIKAVCK